MVGLAQSLFSKNRRDQPIVAQSAPSSETLLTNHDHKDWGSVPLKVLANHGKIVGHCIPWSSLEKWQRQEIFLTSQSGVNYQHHFTNENHSTGDSNECKSFLASGIDQMVLSCFWWPWCLHLLDNHLALWLLVSYFLSSFLHDYYFTSITTLYISDAAHYILHFYLGIDGIPITVHTPGSMAIIWWESSMWKIYLDNMVATC